MNIGFIGLGIMGAPMSKNILNGSAKNNRDTQLTVYNRSPGAYAELESLGAKIAESAAEVARNSEYIFTMLPTGQDVAKIYDELLAQPNEMQQEAQPNKIFVDMSTIEPDVSRRLAQKVAAAGSVMLDAPVVKSQAAAIAGRLGIYVGGERWAFEKVRPILEYIGNEIFYLGGNGAGLVMKICHNMLVGQIQNGVNEMLCLAQKFGIPVSVFAQAVQAGGADNAYLRNKSESIEAGDFTTAFSVRNMNKDVHIAQQLAQSQGLVLPGAENVVRVYEKAMRQNLGDLDFSASFLNFQDEAEK